MIDWLEIRQLAIAEHIALEFGDSFTAVTGETGSGKSLIVGAVGVLLGGRCENGLIRQPQPQAEIQGGFALGPVNSNPPHPALAWLIDNGLDNHNECILRRVVRRDKPSRAYINGRVVNASQLRDLGRELVDIHGQNEHHSLLGKKGQLSLLDNAAGNAELLARLGESYEKLTAVRFSIKQLKNHGDLAREKADLLRFQISELDALAPRPDEWPQLEQQQKRMHHAQDLAVGARAVAARLSEDEGGNLSAALADCCRQLQRLAEYDARLGKVIAMLEEANVNLGESAAQLQAVSAEGALNPDEIAEIEARFTRYHELSRKHRVLPGLLAARLEELRAELSGVADPEAELQRLDAQWNEHKADYDRSADAIGENRARAAKRIEAGVTELMQELGMAGGAFEVRLHKIAAGGADRDADNSADGPAESPTDNISRRGNETVEFVISANPGLPLQPLGKVASGGELSRISLGLNVVLAADAPTSTLIFDEVDVGIGGRVAEVVGEKLRQLGRNRQVICITHLSQVAAKGHHHWSVAKQTGQQASVSVQPLDHKQRIEEIARMTAGAELTPQSLAHAERLLQSA